MIRNRYYTIFSFFLFFFFWASTIQAQGLNIDKIAVVETNDNGTPAAQNTSTSAIDPLFLENTPSLITDEDLFGKAGSGFVHPFLNIGAEYSDNLFNVNDDKKSNFLTQINPGIWLALPRSKRIPITINPNNTSVGGLQVALDDTKSFDRINAYILGAVDFKNYSEDSSLNDHDARAEGLFQINLRGGLSFRVIDRFSRGHDRFEQGNATSGNLRRYNSNIALTDFDWDFTEKLRTKIEYSNFSLSYSDDINNELDRIDNSISWYGYYTYSPKTSLLLQYQYVATRYDTAEIKDNNNNLFYSGINWKATDKTSVHLKAGYQQKKFTNDTIETTENTDSLAFELIMDYKFTQKTNMAFTLSHKIDESDTSSALNKKVSKGVFKYNQFFTERLLGNLTLSYQNDDYQQNLEMNRDDDRYIVRPSMQYVFREWLMAELAYSYDARYSTIDDYDFKTNSILFSLNSAF